MPTNSHQTPYQRTSVPPRVRVAPTLVALALTSAATLPVAAQILFEQPVFIDEAPPQGVVLGDVDGDGDLDVVTSNTNDDIVTVRLNEKGLPLSPRSFAVGRAPDGLALGDLDGDDDLDLAVANTDSANLTVLLNDGHGTFATAHTFVVGAGANRVAMGDLDGDGDTDMVATSRLDGTATVFRNHGDATFAFHAIHALGHEPSGVAIGDLDGDGRADVVITRAGRVTVEGWGDVVMMRNLGDADLAAPVPYTTGLAPSGVAIGDIDGDGAPDLAVTNGGGRELTILPNRGGGDFGDGTVDSNIYFDASPYPRDVHLADIDDDGDLDAVAAGYTSIVVMKNNGGCAVCQDGGDSDCCFGNGGTGCETVACAAKICADDPYCCNVEWDSVCAARARYTSFARRQHYDADIVHGAPVWRTALGDMDGDGAVDLVATSGVGELGWLSVLANDGNAVFAAEVLHRVGDKQGLGAGPLHATVADLNGDLAPDLVTANRDTNDVSVLLNQGNGTLGDAINYAAGSFPRAVVAGDFDGDGDPDLAVANRTSATVSLLLNDGGGTLESPRELPAGLLPVALASGDLDQDGDLDLVVGYEFGETISVLRNDGDGTFAPHVTHAAGTVPWSVAVGDFDGDGRLDIAAAARRDAAVTVLLNTEGETFAPPLSFPVNGEPRSLVIGDWDDDGDLDAATVSGEATMITVLANDGAAGFSERSDYAAWGDVRHLTAGDVDGDRDLDLIVANGNFTYSVMRNEAGAFERIDYRTQTWETSSVTLADFDGDDRLDLAITDAYPDYVFVAPNRYAEATRCAADLDETGTVDVRDVLRVLFAWGPCANCPEDLDGSGIVDVADLGHLLLHWGDCP